MKARLLRRLFLIANMTAVSLSTAHAEPPHQSEHMTYSAAQTELREVVSNIARDIMAANIEGLRSAHLESDKFSKFGPRKFERQDLSETNASEARFFSSIENVNYSVNDLKIDVFGDIGIVTYYPHVTFVSEGESKTVDGRQTLVFLKTDDGWKIVHEHGTVR